MRGRVRLSAALALAAAAGACGGERPVRPQLVVVLDTDAPVPQQVRDDPALSADAAIDTVRVDVLDGRGGVVDFLDVVAPEVLDWPVSFGVASVAGGGEGLTLRVRAFRGSLARPGLLDGVTTLEPLPSVTIDRLVELALPREGIDTVRVLLAGDCLGRPVDFVYGTTCVSGSALSAPATDGVERDPASPTTTRVGTWPAAREAACAGRGREGAVCIPGGFSLLGDVDATGLDPGDFARPSPPVPVVLPPFWMDATEFTVGRLRHLVRRGLYDGALPYEAVPANIERAYCTWLGPDDPTNDDYAVGCLGWPDGQAACRAVGGRLPSEARWEHAARGRGQGRRFPWGHEDVQCCTSSVSRVSWPGVQVMCAGRGPEPVGSHPASDACGGLGDVSRDGVLDLGGSATELTLDSFVPFGEGCWAEVGIRHDPVCESAATTSHVQRGASWDAGPTLAVSALRRRVISVGNFFGSGFRCVYEDEP